MVGTTFGQLDSPCAGHRAGMDSKVFSSEDLSAVSFRCSGSSGERAMVRRASVAGFDPQFVTDQDSLAGKTLVVHHCFS